MCLLRTTPISIERQPAFKIFSIHNDKLRSAFRSSLACRGLDLNYGEGRIQVSPPDQTFFAFKSFNSALGVCRGGRRAWNFSSENLVVLPVTLYDVVQEGYLHEESDDPQCLDGWHEAYEAKEIEVHDSEENRMAFYKAVLECARLNSLEKIALQHILKGF